jgi:hypothetical protein
MNFGGQFVGRLCRTHATRRSNDCKKIKTERQMMMMMMMSDESSFAKKKKISNNSSSVHRLACA